jgi:hypothetical protein
MDHQSTQENMFSNSYMPLSLAKKAFLLLFVLKLKFDVLSVWYMISFKLLNGKCVLF